jgi:hypothetical protein
VAQKLFQLAVALFKFKARKISTQCNKAVFQVVNKPCDLTGMAADPLGIVHDDGAEYDG